MSYDEMMRMLKEINERRVQPKVDIPDFLKKMMAGIYGGRQNA